MRAEELARTFEISARTVYRDIVALGEAGVGYSLARGYHLPPVMFTADEALADGGGRGSRASDDGCFGGGADAGGVGYDPLGVAGGSSGHFGPIATGDGGVGA